MSPPLIHQERVATPIPFIVNTVVLRVFPKFRWGVRAHESGSRHRPRPDAADRRRASDTAARRALWFTSHTPVVTSSRAIAIRAASSSASGS